MTQKRRFLAKKIFIPGMRLKISNDLLKRHPGGRFWLEVIWLRAWANYMCKKDTICFFFTRFGSILFKPYLIASKENMLQILQTNGIQASFNDNSQIWHTSCNDKRGLNEKLKPILKGEMMRFTMKKLGVLILAAALFCGFSGFANAKGGKGDGPARYMEQLTEAQQQQAKAIFDEGRSAAQSLRKEISSKKAELAEIMKSENPDSSRIEALSKELGELRGKEMAARMETEAKLKQAGLPELKKPEKDDNRPQARKDGKQDFAAKRIAKLPEAKQAEAKKIYDEYQAETSQLRESVKVKKAELEKAKEAGDTAAVTALSTELGELKGKQLVAKTNLHQNLAKADIPVDTFDRPDKKDAKKGKSGKDGKRGKGGKKDKHGKDGKRGDKRD